MTRYITFSIGECKNLAGTLDSWPQIAQIDVNRIGIDVSLAPERNNFAYTDQIDEIKVNVTPIPLESDLRRMIDNVITEGDLSFFYQIQRRPMNDGPVAIDFKFNFMREIDFFAFGTDYGYDTTPRHYALYYKKPGSQSWEPNPILEVAGNKQLYRSDRVKRVTTRELRMEIYDCDRVDNTDEIGYLSPELSSENHWPNFTWFQIYDFDAGFMDNTFDRDPSSIP